DPAITYPVVEYGQNDPLLQNSTAVTGVVVYRADAVPALRGRLLFGDFPSGEIFHVSADSPPQGGHEAIRRVLLRDAGGEVRTFLEVIRAKNLEQGRNPASRADLR